MPNVIRLGDPTSHGGNVVNVSAMWFTVDSIAVARVGDKCSCPIHGNGIVKEGNPHHTVDGVAVAYANHQTSCGAQLESTIGNFSDE